MITTTAIWKPYCNVDEALSDAMDGQTDIINLIGTVLDECEALALLAMHAPDYARQDEATTALAERISRTTGYDEEIVQDVLREVAGLACRHRWNRHMERLNANRREIAQWRSYIEKTVDEMEQSAEDKLSRALEESGLVG